MWPDQGNLKLKGPSPDGASARAILSKLMRICETGRALRSSESILVQRLYGHRLNQDGRAKRQSSPRTPVGGDKSRRGMKPRVAGSNPAGGSSLDSRWYAVRPSAPCRRPNLPGPPARGGVLARHLPSFGSFARAV